MKITVLYDRNDWKVTSYDNGWAYELRYRDQSVWLQADDADEFRKSTMDIEGCWYDDCEIAFDTYTDVMESDDDRA